MCGDLSGEHGERSLLYGKARSWRFGSFCFLGLCWVAPSPACMPNEPALRHASDLDIARDWPLSQEKTARINRLAAMLREKVLDSRACASFVK